MGRPEAADVAGEQVGRGLHRDNDHSPALAHRRKTGSPRIRLSAATSATAPSSTTIAAAKPSQCGGMPSQAAGVLDFEDAFKLVRERGQLMKETGEQRPGGMAAVVGLDEATLEQV